MEAISEGILISLSIQENACMYVINHLHNLMSLGSSGQLEEAIVHLTRAILLNPTSSIMYASKGKSLLVIHDSFFPSSLISFDSHVYMLIFNVYLFDF